MGKQVPNYSNLPKFPRLPDHDKMVAQRKANIACHGKMTPHTESCFNYWGTLKVDVCEGFCPDCEREGGRHYSKCPQRINA